MSTNVIQLDLKMHFRCLDASNPVFKNCEPAFLRQLVGHLQLYIYNEGMYVVKESQITDSMYLIHSGHVQETGTSRNTLKVFNTGECFGMYEGLNRNTPYAHTYQTLTKSRVLTLHLADWEYLLEHFPQSKNLIFKYMQFDDAHPDKQGDAEVINADPSKFIAEDLKKEPSSLRVRPPEPPPSPPPFPPAPPSSPSPSAADRLTFLGQIEESSDTEEIKANPLKSDDSILKISEQKQSTGFIKAKQGSKILHLEPSRTNIGSMDSGAGAESKTTLQSTASLDSRDTDEFLNKIKSKKNLENIGGQTNESLYVTQSTTTQKKSTHRDTGDAEEALKKPSSLMNRAKKLFRKKELNVNESVADNSESSDEDVLLIEEDEAATSDLLKKFLEPSKQRASNVIEKEKIIAKISRTNSEEVIDEENEEHIETLNIVKSNAAMENRQHTVNSAIFDTDKKIQGLDITDDDEDVNIQRSSFTMKDESTAASHSNKRIIRVRYENDAPSSSQAQNNLPHRDLKSTQNIPVDDKNLRSLESDMEVKVHPKVEKESESSSTGTDISESDKQNKHNRSSI